MGTKTKKEMASFFELQMSRDENLGCDPLGWTHGGSYYNWLVSWFYFTYLCDLQPTYKGVTIHLLSTIWTSQRMNVNTTCFAEFFGCHNFNSSDILSHLG